MLLLMTSHNLQGKTFDATHSRFLYTKTVCYAYGCGIIPALCIQRVSG